MSKLRRLLANREALTVLVFSIGGVVLGLGSNRLLTEVAAPEALGELYLYVNLSLWITLPTASGVVYVWRHWTVARAQGEVRSFSRRLLRGLGIQALLAIVVCVVIALIDSSVVPAAALLPLIVVSIATAASQGLDQTHALERRRITAGLLGLAGTPARQLSLALGAAVVPATGAALLGVNALYSFVVGAISLVLFLRLTKQVQDEPKTAADGSADAASLGTRELLRHLLPYFLAATAIQLATSAERFGLASVSKAETAFFVQSNGLAMAAVSAATSAMNSYFGPLISQAAANDPLKPIHAAWRPLRRYLSVLAVCLAAGCALAFPLAPYVTTIFFGDRFAGVAHLLPWSIVGAAAFSFGQAVLYMLLVARDTIGPNIAAVVPRVIYAGVLIAWTADASSALSFVKLYALYNFTYVAMVVVASVLAWRREKARLAAVG